jgi:hypothetical protein
MSQPINEARSVLIAPVVVDFGETSGRLYRNGELPPQFITDDPSTYIALSAASSILALKRNRPGTASAFDLSSDDAGDLTPDRQSGLDLATDFAKFTAHHDSTVDTIIYGFADVGMLSNHDPSLIYRGHYMGHTLLTRAEETLAPLAEKIAQQVEEKVRHGHDGLMLDGETLVREGYNSEQSRIPLRGYTYRRSSIDPNERRHFPDFPSCEVFMAAAVLEQLELADNVVRIIPSSMKDREMSARYLLGLLGHTNLPVLSIASSSSGDVQKKIPWYEKPTGYLGEFNQFADSMKAHKRSNQLAKAIHDRSFNEHHALYQEYNQISGSTNIPPSSILESELLTGRVLEVFGRTLRAAPLYEAGKISKEQAEDDVMPDIKLIQQMFTMWHELNDYQNRGHRPYVRHYQGRGSNSVGYIKAVIASRPEVDPVTITGSKYIQLVGHFVHENTSEELLRQFHDTSSSSAKFMELLEEHPPRYVLLEARRQATDDSSIAIISPI